MFALPSKPWKKIKADTLEDGKYLLTFLSPLKNEEEFRQIIEEDLEPSLGEEDHLESPSWENRSIILITSNFLAFQRKLIFHSIMVEKE